MVFLQSYMITPGGHLLETENKRICQISGLIATLVKVLLNLPLYLMQKDITM